MSGGGQVQIANYGLADVMLTGDPQITFWRLKYRRHTMFAMESTRQTFDGNADFGRKATCTISKNGDLVGAVWLEISLPDLLAYDISPTPPDGNSVDVTTQLTVDPNGNYWQTRVGLVPPPPVPGVPSIPPGWLYSDPVAFYDPATSKYYRTATVTSTEGTGAVTEYSSATGLYYGGGGLSGPRSATPVVNATSAATTWPYLCRTGNGPYVYTAPSHNVRWTNSVAHALLVSVEIEIGGVRIDKHYGEWLDIWSELTEKHEKLAGFYEMIGKYPDAEYDAGWKRSQSGARKYYLPLRFCFNTTPGLYLPLVALNRNQIKYNFEFREYLDCVKASVPISQLTAKQGGGVLSMADCALFADFIHLSAPERIRLVEIQHEYLITQLQFMGDEAVPAPSDPNGTRARKYELNFSNPVREMVWVYVAKSNYERNAVTGNNWFKYGVPGNDEAEVFDEARIVINGHDRFSARSAPYFRLVQPYEHHTRCPAKKVHVYSFSLLSPEDDQPTGQANWSRFDTSQLHFSFNPRLPVGRMKIYAYGYNVLRVGEGIASLAFTQ